MGIRVVATNRKANHNYKILEKVESGIVLTGTEVKSIRNNKVSIKESYVRIIKNEIFIIGLNIGSYEAKKFHYYLERHIELDGDEHGPMAEKLVRNLCGSEKENFIEAEEAALDAINARLVFWSEVKEAIEH